MMTWIFRGRWFILNLFQECVYLYLSLIPFVMLSWFYFFFFHLSSSFSVYISFLCFFLPISRMKCVRISPLTVLHNYSLYSSEYTAWNGRMKSTVFWDITPCSPFKVNWRFGGTCHFRLQDLGINRTCHLLHAVFFLLCSFFDLELGGDIFFRNVGWPSAHYMSLNRKR
jgi:hypothetical protein